MVGVKAETAIAFSAVAPNTSFTASDSSAHDHTVNTNNPDADNSALNPPTSAKPVIQRIQFDLKPSPTAASLLKQQVEVERQKHRSRVLRFMNLPGSSLQSSDVPNTRKITETTILGARRTAVRPGFATGFDTSTPEEQQKRQARIARFGPPESHPFYNFVHQPELQASRAAKFASRTLHRSNSPSSNSHLEVKRDAAPGETPRLNTLHLYGVDDLKTNAILLYLSQYGPTWCEWLNDSSCNVVFEDEFTLKRVLDRMSLPVPPDDMKMQSVDEKDNSTKSEVVIKQDGNTELMDTLPDVEPKKELEWRPLRPLVHRDKQLRLWGRMATTADKRPEMPNPKSQWSRTVNGRNQANRSANWRRGESAHRRPTGITKSNKRNNRKKF